MPERVRTAPTSGNAYMRDLVETSLLAAVVGALTGFVAIGVRYAISFFTGVFFRGRPELEFTSPALHGLGPWVIVVPALGAAVAYVIVRATTGDHRIRGSTDVVRSVFQRGGRMSTRQLSGHAAATIIQVGSGGSAGREGAMVQFGAVLGQWASRVMGSSVRHRKILLAAGGAAAVGATFNTPIAGVLFAHEVILLEWTTRAFVPLTVASAMGTMVATRFLGDQPAFPIPPYELASGREIVFYLALGVLAGLLSILILRSIGWSDRLFARIPGPEWTKPVIGGLMLGVLAYFVPSVLGVGYETVQQTLEGDFVATLLFGVLLAKVAAFAITRGSTGASGSFSPSFFMGATLGGTFGAVVHYLFPSWTGNAAAYAMVGMAAVYAATTRASLTAIVMMYEMTHTFSIVIPLMLAVVVADALAKSYGRGNYYRMPGGKESVSPETDAAVNILDLVQVNEIMTKNVETVQADAPVRQVVEKRFSTGHQGYPVVDAQGNLVGIVTSTDMRTRVKEGDLDRPIREFMTPDPAHVFPAASVHDALMQMVARNIGHLPVVHDEDPRRVVGFLTRQDVLGVERRALAEEERHDPYFHWPRRR